MPGKQGFASMDLDRRRAIAIKGGKTSGETRRRKRVEREKKNAKND